MPVTVSGVFATESGPAVFLSTEDGRRILPIWIGGTEALAIQLRHERRQFRRPLTHDLLDRIMQKLGGKLVEVRIDDLKGDTFVGTVYVKSGTEISHFDARPSDSIALALGSRAPIYVSKKVMRRAGLDDDNAEQRLGPPPEDPRAPAKPRRNPTHEL